MTANPLSPLPGGPAPTAAPAANSRFTPLDPLRIVRQYAKWFIAAGVLGLGVGVGLYYALNRYSPEYTASSTVLVTGGLPDGETVVTGYRTRLPGDTLGMLVQTQIAILRSDQILQDVLKKDAIRRTEWYNSFKDPMARLKDMKDRLGTGQVRNSPLITISFDGKNPNDLPRIVDEVTHTYLKHNQIQMDSGTLEARRMFNDELLRAEEEIKKIKEDMARYRTENQLNVVEAHNSEAQLEFQKLADRRMALETYSIQARQNYEQLLEGQRRNSLTPTPEEIYAAEQSPSVSSRDERLRGLREQRASLLLQGYGEKHSEVQKIDQFTLATQDERKREIDRLLRERQAVRIAQAKSEADNLETQLTEVNTKLDVARTRVRELNAKLEEYKKFTDLMTSAEERRNHFTQQIRDLQMRSNNPNNVEVKLLSAATNPQVTFPTFSGIVIPCTVLFIGLATAVVFLKELLDQRVKSPMDLKLIPNAELLGVLPEASEDPLGPVRMDNAVKTDPSGLMAESFRQVRTGILARIDRRGYKTLMVVGAQPGSGTSAVVNNLALSLAYNGRRVLVLEVNLRRPAQQRLFDTPLKPGLVDVLRGGATLEQAIVHKSEPKLDVLPVGEIADAPPELLESPAFRQLLGQLESRYDLVLIDAPPALLTSESQLLSRHVDAVVAVVRAMQDKRGLVGRMLRQLDGHRADLLGVIVNGVRSSTGGYFKKNYEAFYKYRQEAGGRTGSRDRAAEALAANGRNGNGDGNGNGNGNGHGTRAGEEVAPLEDKD